MTALRSRGLMGDMPPLIVVLSLDDAANAFATARELRNAGFRAEAYVGTKKFGDQLKYADKRGAALAIIEGSDEVSQNPPVVTIKNLAAGAEMAKSIESRAEYLGARQAQETVGRADLVATVAKMLGGG
jgi:histidyl-tRNA synthetase